MSSHRERQHKAGEIMDNQKVLIDYAAPARCDDDLKMAQAFGVAFRFIAACCIVAAMATVCVEIYYLVTP